MAGWSIQVGDKTVRVEDLPLVEFEKITEKHGVNWYLLLGSPGAYPSAFYDLIVLACGQAGVDPPERPVTMGDVVKLVDMLQMGDDLPEMWTDGVPPEAGQATT